MMPTIHMQNRRAQIPHCVFMGLPYILCLCLLKEYIYMHFFKNEAWKYRECQMVKVFFLSIRKRKIKY